MLTKFLVAVAAATLLCHGNTQAAPVNVTVGGATIAIPEPHELVALRNFDSPYYKFASEMQSANKNRLLAVFLPAAKAIEADKGMIPSPRDWALVFTLGANGGQAVTLSQFQQEYLPTLEAQFEKALRDNKIQQSFGASADQATGHMLAELGKDPDAATLRMGVISPFGVYARKDNYLVYGSGTKISVEKREGNSAEMPMVMIVGFVAVKSRLFAFGVYRILESREDIAAAKARALEWAEALAKANP